MWAQLIIWLGPIISKGRPMLSDCKNVWNGWKKDSGSYPFLRLL